VTLVRNCKIFGPPTSSPSLSGPSLVGVSVVGSSVGSFVGEFVGSFVGEFVVGGSSVSGEFESELGVVAEPPTPTQ